MAVTADSVVVELIARNDNYNANINGSAAVTDAAMSRIERSASKAEAQVVKSSGAMANAQRNLGRQISDIGTQLAGGQSPFLILAQQAPQVADALADTGGKAARVASFFAGPWGAALLAAGSIAGVLVGKLFDLDEAQNQVKKSADAVAEAEQILQGVLGGTINLTERARIAALSLGQAKIFEARAVLNAAQAQLALAKSYAASAAATERAAPGTLQIPGRGAASSAVIRGERELAVNNAQVDLNALEIRFRNLQKLATGARAVEANKEGAKAEKEANAAARKATAAKRREEAAAEKAQREAEQRAREEAQFIGQRLRGQVELAAAEADLTTDSRLQDEVLRRRIQADRDAAKAQIAADPDRSGPQKAELSGIEDRIAAAKLRLVNINETQRFLDETLALQRADLSNQQDLVADQADLANNLAERRASAVRLLDLAFERERLELEAVVASKKTTDVEKQIAQKRLDQLGTLYGARREGVNRQFEGVGASYKRSIDNADIGEMINGAAVDGLRTFNDQLAEAITNGKSLGDVFHNVSRQIIADLLRIAIQQAVIKPLAAALFGGEGATSKGGGIGGLLRSVGSIFGGPKFATGGSMVIGGRGGVDQNQLSLNGLPLAQVSKGETLSIVPAGKAQPTGGGAVTIIQNFTLDNRQGITTPQLLQAVNAQIEQKGNQARDQAVTIARKGMPAAQQRYSQLGTT